MTIEKPESPETIHAEALQAGIKFLETTKHQAVELRFMSNAETYALGSRQGPTNELLAAMENATHTKMGSDQFGPIFTELASWAEDNGWQRRDDTAMHGDGIIRLRKKSKTLTP
ncbi:hypothetical protein HY417_00130 [Candidatus Kaiserbacteria bacterium]|nr:hypothetical protein [Candidatus Kaiserbacteria bacterium]